MKSTACRHKLAAIAIASGATLAIAGGTAFATPGEQVKDPDEHAPKGTVDSKNASLAIGAAQIDQNSGVTNFSAAATNSGFNSAHNGVDQGNATGQNCSANTSGGGTLAVGLGTRSRDEGRASTGGTAQVVVLARAEERPLLWIESAPPYHAHRERLDALRAQFRGLNAVRDEDGG